jgi:hypothetical protein
MTKIRAVCASVLLATVGVGAAATASANPVGAIPAARSVTCSGTIGITQMQFVPSSVASGGSSTVHLVAKNCTDQIQSTEVTWLGSFRGTHLSGCPIIDPLAQPATFKPHSTFRAKIEYEALSGCTATRLQVTARFAGSGGQQVAEKSADLTITP